MRLDFNVLWLDDQPANIQSYSGALRSVVRRDGFDLKVRNASTVAEVKGCIKDTVFADSLDLVLVDCDLGAAESGDAALASIRTAIGFRDIIFYSSSPAKELRRKAMEQNVEGVFCATRGDLVETAKGVFEAIAKKVLDLDHCRGIVMGATSDIDEAVVEILTKVHAGANEAGRGKLMQGLSKGMQEKLQKLLDQARDVEAKPIEEVLGYYDLVTSNDRLRVLMGVLRGRAGFEDARVKVGKYMSEVVPKRTLLAHVKPEEATEGRVLVGKDGKRLTEEDLRILRCNLLEHRENFDDLMRRLGIA